MLTLNDGRNELWQWDTSRKLTVGADCSQVHFSNKVFGRSIDVDVVDGVAIIPDILLQTDKDLNAWAFVGTAENGYTKISKTFKVNRRNKPADYVFTPHDQTTLGEIVQRLEELEAMQDPDAIKNAVDEYLANNPIEVEETDPTVPDWAKQPKPPKVEIPEVNIPTTLPNPHPLTFTGAATGTYDGSAPLTVNIPAGGGGTGGGSSGTWELIGEVTSDGAGNSSGIYVPIDFTQYKEVFIEAWIAAGAINRVLMSSSTAWYNGQIVAANSTTSITSTNSPRTENVLTQTFICNICGELKPYSGHNSGYTSGAIALYPIASPRETLLAANYAYVRLDANNNGAVAEGNWLKVWGCK